MTSYHAQQPGPAWRRCSSTCATGHDLALVTDAGTPAVSDPGAELVRRLGGRRGARSCRCPGASAVLAAVAATGHRRAALVVRGVPAAVGARAPRAAGPDRGRRPRGAVLYEAPGRVAATLRDLAAACGGRARRRRLSRADEAATNRSSGARSASSRRRRPTGASRHAASSCSWSASGRPMRSPAWPRPGGDRRRGRCAGRRARRGRAPRGGRHGPGRGGRAASRAGTGSRDDGSMAPSSLR